MQVFKCDICGEVQESGPNCLAMIDGVADEFEPWGECTNVSFKRVLGRGTGTVLNICDDCLKRVKEYVENKTPAKTDQQSESIGEKLDDLIEHVGDILENGSDMASDDENMIRMPYIKEWLFKVKLPYDTDDHLCDLVLKMLEGIGAATFLRTHPINIIAVYTTERKLWDICWKLTSLGLNFSWGKMEPGELEDFNG